jgi:hypothetical protein
MIIIFGAVVTVIVNINYPAMDYGIYTAASELAFEDKQNPYITQNLIDKTGHHWPFRYPPITLPFFYAVTRVHHYISWTVIAFFAIFIFWLANNKKGMPLFAILTFTVFMGALECYSIGNIGLVDLLLFSITILFISKGKEHYAAMMFGVMAIFKTVPIAYVATMLFLDKPWKEKVKYVLLALIAFFVLQTLSAFMFKEYTTTFYGLLFNGYPVVDANGFNNPSLYALVNNFIKGTNGFITYLFIVATVGIFHLVIMSKVKDKMIRFSLTMMAIMLVLPELKNFTYVIAAIPLYYLLEKENNMVRTIMLGLVGVLPIVLWASFSLFQDTMRGTITHFFYGYGVYFILWFTYLIFSIRQSGELARVKQDEGKSSN